VVQVDLLDGPLTRRAGRARRAARSLPRRGDGDTVAMLAGIDVPAYDTARGLLSRCLSQGAQRLDAVTHACAGVPQELHHGDTSRITTRNTPSRVSSLTQLTERSMRSPTLSALVALRLSRHVTDR
jgi:hypothetical protein